MELVCVTLLHYSVYVRLLYNSESALYFCFITLNIDVLSCCFFLALQALRQHECRAARLGFRMLVLTGWPCSDIFHVALCIFVTHAATTWIARTTAERAKVLD